MHCPTHFKGFIMDEALNVFRGIEKQAVHNQFYIKPNRSPRLTSRTLNSRPALKELLALMELVKTVASFSEK